jgi:hypothetical protein
VNREIGDRMSLALFVVPPLIIGVGAWVVWGIPPAVGLMWFLPLLIAFDLLRVRPKRD